MNKFTFKLKNIHWIAKQRFGLKMLQGQIMFILIRNLEGDPHQEHQDMRRICKERHTKHDSKIWKAIFLSNIKGLKRTRNIWHKEMKKQFICFFLNLFISLSPCSLFYKHIQNLRTKKIKKTCLLKSKVYRNNFCLLWIILI